ncbi:ribonucleoside triphosphate reductase [Halanaerobium hydrogeniformans]|uniref:Anaerobic ribonucleoside-triphosphate reductase n=1 Tax=Halanaerobium hydrogeniformans TaxID=656519 RepID=E4RKD5_HALHG|nr:ribonucleoside triphosphate reductase [Halanaerobium hydrogeniformans]ADQ15648.1 anaerobic ribonucleoside-triphosphate reductase [Halanaerobium hydrogeniformans]
MALKYVKKRNGKKVDFNSDKIKAAVIKAAEAVESNNDKIGDEICSEVISYLKIFFKDGGIVEVEQIQDLVEKVLIEKGYADVAKAYILYREQHSKLRDTKKLFADAVNIMDNYLDRSDWKVNENSNMSYSLQGLNNFIASEVTGQYWLQQIYSDEIEKLHKDGDLHVHDLGNLSVYCCGWDLEDLLRTGFRGVPTKIESSPPRHLQTALGQITNFYYTLQGEAAGAMAFSNFDTYLAPFIAYDNLNYEEVKQIMQEFLFNMNVPTRVGFQTPFTNITMDLEVPNYLKEQSVIIGGEYKSKTYGEFQEEMDKFNRAFAEVMMDGDAKGRMFSFPIPTYNITDDFDWNNPVLDPVWEMTAKFGIPYFSNFINSDMNPEDARSMCCRLRLDNKELRKRGGGLFGANPMTGSIGVVTLNMPRIGYLAADKADFINRVYRLMDISKDSLEIKRKVLENLTEQGLYPYSKFYLRDVKKRFDEYWKNHFNTIGLNGMNEALLNFMDKDIASQDGQKFALEVMDAMRDKLQEYQEKTDNLYNLEATPAEGTAYRFARLDKEKFGDSIISANEDRVINEGADPYYTNSTQLPVNLTDDIFTALELQDELQSKYTGGCIEKGNKVLTDKGLMKIEEIVKNYENLKPIMALSYNEEYHRSEWDLITDAVAIDVSRHDKIRIKAEKDLDITTSDWHPFFVLEPITEKKVALANLKSADDNEILVKDIDNKLFLSGENLDKKYKITEKRADQLKKGDYILQNHYNIYPDIYSKLDQDLMWFLGYFYDRGVISLCKSTSQAENRSNKYQINIFADDKKIILKVLQIMEKYFDADSEIINYRKNNNGYHLTTKEEKAVKFLFDYGFNEGAKERNKGISKTITEQLTQKNVYSLLFGLIDGRGEVDPVNGSARYESCSEKMADDILEIFTMAGIMIQKSLCEKQKKNHYSITIPHFDFLERKIQNNEVEQSNDRLAQKIKRQLPVVMVEEITKIDVEDNQFYDLTTQLNHNYLAGKNTLVFIHNTVLHGFLGEKMPSIKSTKKLVKRIAENFQLPYYTITPTFSICPVHGYLAGEHYYCPKCEAESESEQEA